MSIAFTARTRNSIAVPFVRPVSCVNGTVVSTCWAEDHAVPATRYCSSKPVMTDPPSSGQFHDTSSVPDAGAVAVGCAGADGADCVPDTRAHVVPPVSTLGAMAFEVSGPFTISAL